MRVAVLGAGGLLGSHVCRAFAAFGHTVARFARDACDVTKASDVARAVDGAELVVNCAAYTDADRAESEPVAAYAVNDTGAGRVAAACRRAGATLIHVSTDSVFDGESRVPYREDSDCNPVSVYGRSKLEGERAVAALGGRVYTARVQGLYGTGGTNFASQIISKVCAGERFCVDGERRTQPTWASAAARQFVRLVSRPPGTYHVSCKGDTTWAEFAAAVAEIIGRERTWDVAATSSLGLAARRPRNCVFSHGALGSADSMLGWRETLRIYLESL